MKINYFTENTPLPQNKDQTTDVLLVTAQLCSVQYINLFIFLVIHNKNKHPRSPVSAFLRDKIRPIDISKCQRHLFLKDIDSRQIHSHVLMCTVLLTTSKYTETSDLEHISGLYEGILTTGIY